jgi:hypothetical protein
MATFRITVTACTESKQAPTREQMKNARYAQNIDLGNCGVCIQRVKVVSREFHGPLFIIAYDVTARSYDVKDSVDAVRRAIDDMMMWWGGEGWDVYPRMTIASL